MTKHLTYGGSTAARTLGCPGWVEKSKGIAKPPVGQAAIDGSMHHAIQEMCQKGGSKPEDHLGYVYKEGRHSRAFTIEDLYLSEDAFATTEALLDRLDIDEMLVEPFVQLVEGEVGGSIDLLGLSHDRKTALVLDYKFGRKAVSPENSAQLSLYTLSAMADKLTSDMFDTVDTFIFAVIQPQAKETEALWACNLGDLRAFEQQLSAALESDRVTPGAHCNWCPASPYCDVKRQAIHEATLLDTQSHNELSSAAGMIEQVETWLASAKEEVFMQLSRGVKIDGWKVVDKRATRKWIDEAQAEKAMRRAGMLIRDIRVKNLITAAVASKMVASHKIKLDLTPFIIKTSSGTTLAPDSDPRDAVVVTDVADSLAEIMKT